MIPLVRYLLLALMINALPASYLWAETPLLRDNLQNSALSLWVDQTVQVQFRRDSLENARNPHLAPRNQSSRILFTLKGTLKDVRPGSLLVENEKGDSYWIPREVILMVVKPAPKPETEEGDDLDDDAKDADQVTDTEDSDSAGD